MMLLPVLPFMTKSNLDLALNLVSPLGFLGSLRVVIVLLCRLPCLTITSCLYALALSRRESFPSLRKKLLRLSVWAQKETSLGDAWGAQSVEHPTSAQVMIARFVSSSPALGSLLSV